jgi:hypothetical protein
MSPFLDATRRFFIAAGRAFATAAKAAIRWLSVPVNLCLAVLGLVFFVSFATWAFTDRFEQAVLFFPDSKDRLRGEVREVPHSAGPEARAELVASELLLGPENSSLSAAFLPGVRVESVLLRKGRLFLDISQDAALAPPKSLKGGIAAMERSLRAALPGLKRLSLTIGGKEPYADGLAVEGGTGIKKAGK